MIYNIRSSYLKKRPPETKYVVFYGLPKEGGFIVEVLKVIGNPKIKFDDYDGEFEIYYDGKNKSNCIWR